MNINIYFFNTFITKYPQFTQLPLDYFIEALWTEPHQLSIYCTSSISPLQILEVEKINKTYRLVGSSTLVQGFQVEYRNERFH